MTKRILVLLSWSISSFFFLAALLGLLASVSISQSLVMAGWGLVFSPALYSRLTRRYGWKRNAAARLAAFFITPVLIVSAFPPAQQAQTPPPEISTTVTASSPPRSKTSAGELKSAPTQSLTASVPVQPSPSLSPVQELTSSVPVQRSPSPSATPLSKSETNIERSPEIVAGEITKKYFDACSEGVAKQMGRISDFSVPNVREKYGYDGFFGPFLFSEALCQVAKSRDGFSSESQAKQAGANILLEVGEAYKRGEMFRELIKK